MYDNLKERIVKAMYLHRPLSIKEQQFVAKWKEELKLKDEIIIEAVKRGRKIKGESVSFYYINGILENWASKGVKSEGDILVLDKEFREGKKEDDKDYKKGTVKIELLSDTAKVIVKGSIIRLFADVKEEHSLELWKNYIIPLNVSVSIPYGHIGLIELDPNLGLYLASDKIIVGKDKKLELNVKKLIGADSVLRSGDKIARLVLVNGFTGDAEVVKYKKQS